MSCIAAFVQLSSSAVCCHMLLDNANAPACMFTSPGWLGLLRHLTQHDLLIQYAHVSHLHQYIFNTFFVCNGANPAAYVADIKLQAG